jgi:hypothetical protein
LVTLDVLTPTQTKQYIELRGYAGGHVQHQHGGHKH